MKITRYKKGLVVLIHAAAWILLFSLPYLLRPTYHPNEQRHQEPVNQTVSFIISRVSDLLLIGFFYLNAEFLIARFFYKKKYFIYSLGVLFCFVVYATFTWLLFINFTYTDAYFTFRKHLFFCTFIFIFILACSIAYKTIRDKIKFDNLSMERQNENLRTELSLLRSQVSPHFMFNVLNNMVALARKKSELLEPSLIKLSSLMRYMLYETGEQKVSLEKESDYLQSYIDLQLQRFGKKLTLNLMIDPPDKSYEIEPMLLIPFVENAFKHGTGLAQNAEITVQLTARDNRLNFVVTNKFDPLSSTVKDNASGIGLANVKRRLELLYMKEHSLDITQTADTFRVALQIHLA
jgi:sensor histidine kinase YesM